MTDKISENIKNYLKDFTQNSEKDLGISEHKDT